MALPFKGSRGKFAVMPAKAGNEIGKISSASKHVSVVGQVVLLRGFG
jgi:hypothetical protein